MSLNLRLCYELEACSNKPKCGSSFKEAIFPNAADAMLSPDIDSDAKRDHQRENLWYHVGQTGERA